MIKFVPFETTQLYVLEENSPEGGGYFAFFLSDVPGTPPTEIPINASWDRYKGFYLFLKNAPPEESMPAFAAAIKKYFDDNDPNPPHTGFAWVEYNPETEELGTITTVNTEETTANGPGEETVVSIAENMQFEFRNYSLPLRKAAPIQTVRDTGDNIVGFTFEYPPYEGAPKPRQAFNTQLPLVGDPRGTLTGQVSLGDLSANPATGWNASLYYVVNFEGKDEARNYPLFNLDEQGLQILFDYMLDPVDPLNPDRSYLAFTGTSFFLRQNPEGQWYIEENTANRMATFFRTIYGKKIDLIPLPDSEYPPKLVFEELPPEEGKPRFYLAPAGDFELAVQGEEEKEAAASFQLLAGLSGAESFAFLSKTKTIPGDILRFEAGKNAYVPVFPILKPRGDDGTVTVRRAANARAAFLKARDRYLKAGAPTQTGELLTEKYRTSWVNLRPNPGRPAAQPTGQPAGGLGKPLTRDRLPDLETDEELERLKRDEANRVVLPNETPIYFSQPNDAALYDHEAVEVNVKNELLQLRDTPAALFSENVNQSVPLVPYSGVSDSPGFSYENIRELELQVITPSRREAVSSIPTEPQVAGRTLSEETMVQTTTPQGLLATVPEFGLNWQSVLLAKSMSRGVPYDLEFTGGITKELRDALQSNQLFLVATESAPLGTFKNKITIADWPFTIDVGKGSELGNFRNVMIFKFAGGSIEERVKDPRSWSGGGVFNDNPALVSNWITSYIENTRLGAENEARLRNFMEIVQNPAWNGILVLRVDIGVESFPDDLKGLLAGIDRNQFFAHHFGIEINFIEPDKDGKLTLPKSSLFGLINYVDRSYRSLQDINGHLKGDPFLFSLQEAVSPITSQTPQSLYDFKVLTLQVVFENSDIKDFESKIQFTTTTWFDEPAQLDTNNMGDSLAQQTVELNGSYEKHNGVNTYTFVTEPDEVTRFLLQSQTMNYVEIVKAQFNTLNAPPDGGEGTGEEIFTRFTFWGYMNFKMVESFDIFSFGDIPDVQNPDRRGLYFANLAVNMDFVLDNESGAVTGRTFSFDPDRMSFDISQSTPRSGSLFKNFPIKLSGLIYSKDGDTKPPDLGFLPIIIQSPTPVGAQALTDKWYALVYDLNLGSMGALAAKAGFVSRISTAWSPDTGVRRLTVGIQLPGVGGGQKTLSLQSVLNVNIQSFTFISSLLNGGAGAESISYLLRFNNIKLSILGKKLPGAADTQFILFGDSTGSDKTTLAWYAAYYRKEKKALRGAL